MKYAELQNTKTSDLLRIYIYICLHLCQTPIRIHKGSRPCSMHVPAKWCFLAKGVTSSLSPRAQNDSDDHTIFKIWEFPAADCVAHGASFLGMFFNWSSLYQMDHQMDYRPPETATANHPPQKKDTQSCFQMEFPGFGVFFGLQDTNCSFLWGVVPWFHGVPWWNGLAKMLDLAARSTYWPFNLAAPGAPSRRGRENPKGLVRIDTLFPGHHLRQPKKLEGV